MSALAASAIAQPSRSEARRLRSVGAVLAALVANAVACGATDQVFHVLGVYPPWGAPMFEASDNLLALSYRLVFGTLGAYLVARLAPRSPMRHALAYGAVGVAVSLVGAIATVVNGAIGPAWYPLMLAATALPCSWLGARLYERRHG